MIENKACLFQLMSSKKSVCFTRVYFGLHLYERKYRIGVLKINKLMILSSSTTLPKKIVRYLLKPTINFKIYYLLKNIPFNQTRSTLNHAHRYARNTEIHAIILAQ